MATKEQLVKLLEPAVAAAGYELWGIEYLTQGKGALLRVYIESDDGIDVDDCAKVSHQVSGVLDVEDPISSEYTLEVSSPGLERPLFTLAQFERYLGEQVKVKTGIPVAQRRNFKGVIEAVVDDEVQLRVDQDSVRIPHAHIEKAHLVADFDAAIRRS